MRRCPNGWTTSTTDPESLMEGEERGRGDRGGWGSGSAPKLLLQLECSVYKEKELFISLHHQFCSQIKTIDQM